MYMQDEYKLVHPEKYVGDKPPFYRSSYERRFFHYCDNNKNVTKWASEPFFIEYLYKEDGKKHKYWIDAFVVIKDNSGIEHTYIVEIKPEDQVKKPNEIKLPRRKTVKAMENYLYAVKQAQKNQDKWEAARLFCEQKGYEFKIITEKELFNGV